MDHITENTIEKYIASSEELNADRIHDIESHIDHCAECHEIYCWLNDFYDEFHRELSQVEFYNALVNSLNGDIPDVSTYRITLVSYHDEEYHQYGGRNHVVLAAQSKPKTTRRFNNIATFYSNDAKLVARILYDNQSDQYHLFVISEDPRWQDVIIFSLPENNMELVTDQKARSRFTLSAEKKKPNWSDIRGVLLAPVDRFSVGEKIFEDIYNKGEAMLTTDNGSFHFERIEHDQIALQIDSWIADVSNISRIVVRSSDGATQLTDIKEGKGVIKDDDSFSRESDILIYH